MREIIGPMTLKGASRASKAATDHSATVFPADLHHCLGMPASARARFRAATLKAAVFSWEGTVSNMGFVIGEGL